MGDPGVYRDPGRPPGYKRKRTATYQGTLPACFILKAGSMAVSAGLAACNAQVLTHVLTLVGAQEDAQEDTHV